MPGGTSIQVLCAVPRWGCIHVQHDDAVFFWIVCHRIGSVHGFRYRRNESTMPNLSQSPRYSSSMMKS